jgi:hypothetical protein
MFMPDNSCLNQPSCIKSGENDAGIMMLSRSGCAKPLFIAVASLVFLTMGIDMLVAAYRIENPIYFIMTFFSSSLMILISITGFIYSSIRIHNFFRQKR